MAERLSVASWLKQAAPPEHGSWAFVLEPALIAGLLTGNWGPPGAVVLLFLAYRPFALGVRDLSRKKRYPRMWPNVVVGGTVGLAGAILLGMTSSLVLLGLLAGAGFLFGLTSRLPTRSLARELAGALLAVPLAATAFPAAAVAFVLRPLVSVLGVRGLLGREADAPACRWGAVVLGGGLAGAALSLPNLPAAAYGILVGRALFLAATPQWERKPVRVGIAESAFSILVVVAWGLAG